MLRRDAAVRRRAPRPEGGDLIRPAHTQKCREAPVNLRLCRRVPVDIYTCRSIRCQSSTVGSEQQLCDLHAAVCCTPAEDTQACYQLVQFWPCWSRPKEIREDPWSARNMGFDRTTGVEQGCQPCDAFRSEQHPGRDPITNKSVLGPFCRGRYRRTDSECSPCRGTGGGGHGTQGRTRPSDNAHAIGVLGGWVRFKSRQAVFRSKQSPWRFIGGEGRNALSVTML